MDIYNLVNSFNHKTTLIWKPKLNFVNDINIIIQELKQYHTFVGLDIYEVLVSCGHNLTWDQEYYVSIEDLMEYVKGPDFPTSGFILGKSGIVDAYKTGKGSIVMRARVEVINNDSSRDKIIITEIPYQVNKSLLLEKIGELVRSKIIDGISDLRDDKSSEG